MTTIRRMTSYACLLAILFSPLSGESNENQSGEAYYATHETLSMWPAVGLVAIALGVIVVFAAIKSTGNTAH